MTEADERVWQEQLIRHLRITEWIVLDMGDRSDLVGEAAQQGLLSRGLVWPPALQIKSILLSALSPGSLITGEGGDEVFGPRRVTPWLHLTKRTGTSRRLAAANAGESVLSRRIRAERLVRRLRGMGLQPWLHPTLAEVHLRLLAEDLASEPLCWDQSVLWLSRRRHAAATGQNYRLLAQEYGIDLFNPFLDVRFLASLGSFGGRLGFATRTEVMRALFSDVLPPETIERRTKALFNRALMGDRTRRFAETWDGTGVDEDLIDIERLRAEWLSDEPSAISSVLLQQAWMASVGTARPQAC